MEVNFKRQLLKKEINDILRACTRVGKISKFNFFCRLLESPENAIHHAYCEEQRAKLGHEISKEYGHCNAKWSKWK